MISAALGVGIGALGVLFVGFGLLWRTTWPHHRRARRTACTLLLTGGALLAASGWLLARTLL